jgi:ComF family protein
MEKFAEKPEGACAVCSAPMDGEVAGAGITSCGRCRTKPPPFDASYYGMRYEGTARELIHRFKFGNATRLAPAVSYMLCAELHSRKAELGADMVIPVPLHRKRLYKRGYNQSALIALEIGNALSIPVSADILKREVHTNPQFSLTIAQRNENIKGAFAVRYPDAVKGKTVILADDIMTTGATLAEAAKTLKKAGAIKVICAVSARA